MQQINISEYVHRNTYLEDTRYTFHSNGEFLNESDLCTITIINTRLLLPRTSNVHQSNGQWALAYMYIRRFFVVASSSSFCVHVKSRITYVGHAPFDHLYIFYGNQNIRSKRGCPHGVGFQTAGSLLSPNTNYGHRRQLKANFAPGTTG